MLFDEDVALQICNRVAAGEPLTKVCEDKGLPSYLTVCKWFREVPDFEREYARARADSAEAGYFEIMEVEKDLAAGKTDPNTARVLIDSIKWRIGRMKPKVYGDRLTLAGDEDAPLHHQLTAQVATLSVERRALIASLISSSAEQPEQALPKPE